MKRGGLTSGQARYVQFRQLGDGPKEAYRKAFPGAGASSIKCNPYLLEKKPAVAKALIAAKIAAEDRKDNVTLRRQMLAAGLSRIEKRILLKKFANDKKLSDRDRLMAIQIDNLMTGDNKPVRFEGEITLNGIFKALQPTTGLPGENELIELDPISS